MEKQLAEFDTGARAATGPAEPEEMHAAELLAEGEKLAKPGGAAKNLSDATDTPPLHSAPASAPVKPKTVASVAVGH